MRSNKRISLPGKPGDLAAKDNLLFVQAILYRYRGKILWRDLPKEVW
ncbi:hypothetical protein P618_200499 [Holospora obtusa F1]|uniref:Transposase n=1 Tax=Holospora obtusa F1 TaxID=1399147 RepID=W6THE4_HOLOB|nr:transposase [Holospora obtusa]ETZ07315.1 hypothetical protein P618_200499 [Holospora obtusa F1]